MDSPAEALVMDSAMMLAGEGSGAPAKSAKPGERC
jgi:hypothetical protein